MVCTSVRAIVLFVWLILKADIEAFQCNNGKTINDGFFCDRDNDCGDESDLLFGCGSCGAGKFTCKDGTCLHPSLRCDGNADCTDRDDEMNCIFSSDKKITPEDCMLSDEKYLCRDQLGCFEFKYACDGMCDCHDCSDESSVNCSKYDSDSCRSCPHYCWTTPNGPQCVCNSSTYESSSFCKKMEDCTGTIGVPCEQYCTRYNLQTRCSCYEDYNDKRGYNGTECENGASYENIILYSTTAKIKALNRTTGKVQNIKSGLSFTALSAAHDFIYYATYSNNRPKGSIFKTLINTGKTDEIIKSDSRITSIAVDWINNNVYFTSNESLSVCDNDGRICRKFERYVIDYVAVAPTFGWMYFTQQIDKSPNERVIMRSNMDGSEKINLVDDSFLFPISIAVYEFNETIFWLEIVNHRLYSTTFHGSNRQMVLISESSVFSNIELQFSAFDEKLYFTKKYDHTIYQYKLGNADFSNFHTDVDTNNVEHVLAHNPVLQRFQKIVNPCTTASCNGLCLLRRFQESLNYSCICENFIPSSDNHWCNDHSSPSTLNSELILRNELNSTVLEKFPTFTNQTEFISLTKSSPGFTTRKEAQTIIDQPSVATISSSNGYHVGGILNYVSIAATISGIILGIISCYIISREFIRRRRRQVNVTELMEM